MSKRLGIGFMATMRRELRRMGSRKIYLFGMIVVPVGMMLFFLSLLSEGLPLHVPTAVVDQDQSAMSRAVIRSLNAVELIDITEKCESFDEAIDGVRRGDTFGFFVIPSNFESDAVAGRHPTIEYYTNMTYFVPGTLSFKGFKTVAVSTAGAVVRTRLLSMGASPVEIGGLLQPVVIDNHPIGNPWTNYSVYLSPSFSMCLLALMVMLMTIFIITDEIKKGTSPAWLATAHNRIGVALAGKLLPHTIVWSVVGLLILSLLFGYGHFPLNGSLGWMILAMVLMVVASQAMGVFIASVLPNPRLAFSVAALVGILAFSVAGFSFPVQNMYGAIGVFSYILPIRYFFLIYINQALNGFDVYYVRWCFVALIIFPLVASLLLWRLKRACLNPVYVP